MPTLQEKAVHIIGAGLAGSEAAWQLANRNIPVVLHEMRGVKPTEAHHTADCAELVCSNSFRSNDHEYNAVGLLHWEMQQLNSLIIKQGYTHAVPAGGALAVDREGFAQSVTQTLTSLPNVQIERGEVDALPDAQNGLALIATGPLTSQPLAHAIQAETGQDALAFFDAIAPIVHKDSIDFSKAWFQSRYDKEGPAGDGRDYINCALEKDQYFAFVEALLEAEKTEFKEWEKNTPYFEGCMPIEIMASRGRNTLRFGPMKPVGLVNPNAPAEWANKPPYAVVQLRQDNALGTLYNMVGFQTKMKWGDQVRVFKTIPGLENAEFARLGGIHRNTFINSPTLLDGELRLKTKPHIRFAGQVTGCEGYVESAAVGLLSALFLAAEYLGQTLAPPPPTTALGALLSHITGGACAKTFQPMNINFGLFPPLDARLENGRKITGRDRKKLMSDRAKIDLVAWIRANGL